MLMGWILVFALLALSFAILAWMIARERRAERVQTRLEEAMRAPQARQKRVEKAQVGTEKEPSALWQKLSLWGDRLAGNEKSRVVTERILAQAGFSREGVVGVFLFLKTVLGLGLAVAIWVMSTEKTLGTFAFALIGYFLGSTAPEWVLKSIAARRYSALERSMPDALDLMVICAEAGLPFTRIVRVVSKEIALSAPVLSQELALTNAELEILPERATALRNLANRTRVPSIESMVSTLIQAEQFGTPLAQALHNIATESRKTLILTLEERAGKLPARLSIPLMTLILPPVVAIVASPALMRVIRSLMA